MRSRTTRNLANIAASAMVCALVAIAYLRDLGRNPFGFFCDEALIGVQARRLLDDTRPEGAFSLFYDHFGTTAGFLPVYATAPFVWLFGLSEFSVRLASVTFMAATFAVLIVTFRQLGLTAPWLPVLIFALSPITIHMSRIAFGHAPSLFLLALGHLLYLRGRDGPRWGWVSLGGVAIGASAYGYPGFYVATPLFLTVLCLSELAFILVRRKRARVDGREARPKVTDGSPEGTAAPEQREATGASPTTLAAFVAGALVTLAPIVHRARTDPDFSKRFDAKDTARSGLFSVERAESMIENYPKYFSLDFLFRNGDWGLPNAFIQRHSVAGAGLLAWIALPLLLLGLLAFVTCRRGKAARAVAPFMVIAFLVPVPDLITTTSDQPPYTFAMFTGALVVPFVTAFGLATLDRARPAIADTAGPGDGNPLRPILALVTSRCAITAVVAIAAFFFVFSDYARYPEVSSGFWGWQAGPQEMTAYYVEHREDYDAFVMEGAFNEPAIFLDFYLDDPALRATASIGGTDAFDPARRQLFGVSRETFERDLDPDAWTIRETVRYPNDEVAFYLIDVRSR